MEVFGYNNWICMQIKQAGDEPLEIYQSHTNQGKWYEWDDKDAEMTEADVNDLTIPMGKTVYVAACGRDSSPTGTNGYVTIKNKSGVKVCKMEFDVPYGALNKCKFLVSDINKDYIVGHELLDKPDGLGNGGPGAYIGKVDIKVAKFG
jgi:hypothetical protein